MSEERSGPGVRVGAPFGVPVYLAPSWFVVAAVLTVLSTGAVQDQVPGLGTLASYGISLVFVLLLYGSVLLHELSHSLVALRMGLPVRKITIYLIGGVSELKEEPRDPAREYLVAMAGPLLSLVLAGAGTAAAVGFADDTVPRLLAEEVALANGLITVFNLLPGLPLDGGRILRSVVWKVSGSAVTGGVVAGWAGRAIALLVATVPFALAAASPNGTGLLTLIWFSLLAAFLYSGASQSLRLTQLKARLPRLALRRLTRPAVPALATSPLAMAMAALEQSAARGIVVVDGEGVPIGVVSEAAVAETPVERRPWTQVGEVMAPRPAGWVLPADLRGEELLQAMRASPASEYLVVEADGSVLGVLATADVARVVTQ